MEKCGGIRYDVVGEGKNLKWENAKWGKCRKFNYHTMRMESSEILKF